MINMSDKFKEYVDSGIYNNSQLAVIYTCMSIGLDETEIAKCLYTDIELPMLYYGLNDEQKSKIPVYFNEYQMYIILDCMMHNDFLDKNQLDTGDYTYNKINIKLFASHWFTWEQMYAISDGLKHTDIDFRKFASREYSPERISSILKKNGYDTGFDINYMLEQKKLAMDITFKIAERKKDWCKIFG